MEVGPILGIIVTSAAIAFTIGFALGFWFGVDHTRKDAQSHGYGRWTVNAYGDTWKWYWTPADNDR